MLLKGVGGSYIILVAFTFFLFSLSPFLDSLCIERVNKEVKNVVCGFSSPPTFLPTFLSLRCHLAQSTDRITRLAGVGVPFSRSLDERVKRGRKEIVIRCEKLIDAFHFVKLQRKSFNWPLFDGGKREMLGTREKEWMLLISVRF